MNPLIANPDVLKSVRLAAGFASVGDAARASGVSSRKLRRLERVEGALISSAVADTLAATYRCPADQFTHFAVLLDDLELVPSAVRAARKAKGWSISDLAAHTGMANSAVLRWEQDPPLRSFDHNRLRRMCRALSIPAHTITRSRCDSS